MAAKRNAGHGSQLANLDALEIPIARQSMSNWEMMLASSLLYRSQDWHAQVDQELREQCSERSWTIHTIRCDGTNATAVQHLKAHVLQVKTRARIGNKVRCCNAWADVCMIPPNCSGKTVRGMVFQQLKSCGVPAWFVPPPQLAPEAEAEDSDDAPLIVGAQSPHERHDSDSHPLLEEEPSLDQEPQLPQPEAASETDEPNHWANQDGCLDGNQGSHIRVVAYITDAGADQARCGKLLVQDTANQLNNIVLCDHCVQHQINLLIQRVLRFDTQYFSQLCTIINVWRSHEARHKIFRAWVDLTDQERGRQAAGCLPPRPLKGRWGSLDAAERFLLRAGPEDASRHCLCSVVVLSRVVHC